MSKTSFTRIFLAAASLLASTAAFGQVELQLRVRQLPGWDTRAREGRCQIRVWVDNRAEVRMRGDAVFVRTLEGSKGRDEGSECSQPLPFNSVNGFQIRQTAGRTRVTLAQEPSRMNNYTAMISIDDAQGGGDNYAFEVSWRADTEVAAAAPAPFFDDVRACQDVVRQRFFTQNGRGSYIDFATFADRQNQEQRPGRGRGRGNANRGQESIVGHGTARNPSESRELSYSCLVDTNQNLVVSGVYQYSGASVNATVRSGFRRILK